MSNAIKKFNILSVLHNYFNNSIKLFSDLYLVKFFSKTIFFFVCNSRAHTRILKHFNLDVKIL